jgi:hypothetical protein
VSTFNSVGTFGVSPVKTAASIWPARQAASARVDEIGPSFRHQIRPEAGPDFVLTADLEAAQIESVHFRNSRLADDEDTHLCGERPIGRAVLMPASIIGSEGG